MRLSWRLATVRLFTHALLLIQVLQAVAERRELSPYMQSYWLVTYRHGFVRRGLTGAVMQPFDTIRTGQISVAAWLVAVTSLVAVIAVMELLFRARTPQGCALAILLACSPFVVEYALYQRRPDLIGIPALVLLGVILLRPRKHLWPMCLAVGVLFAVSVLVHEATAVYAIPWALVMVAVMPSRQPATRLRPAKVMTLLALVSIPALVVVVVVAVSERPSTTKVNALRRDASFLHVGTRPNGMPKATAFDFLADDPAVALDRVDAIPNASKVGSIVLAAVLVAVLVAVQAALLWRWVRPRLWTRLAEAGTPIAVACCIAVAGATAALFALGVDWLRWVALMGMAGLITGAFAVLTAEPRGDRRDRIEVPTILVLVAIALVAIAPLDELTELRGALRTLSLR